MHVILGLLFLLWLEIKEDRSPSALLITLLSMAFLIKLKGKKRHLELSNHAINVQVLDGLLKVEALRVFVLWLKNTFYKQDLINSSDCLRKRLDGSKTCRSLTRHEPKIRTYGIYEWTHMVEFWTSAEPVLLQYLSWPNCASLIARVVICFFVKVQNTKNPLCLLNYPTCILKLQLQLISAQ